MNRRERRKRDAQNKKTRKSTANKQRDRKVTFTGILPDSDVIPAHANPAYDRSEDRWRVMVIPVDPMVPMEIMPDKYQTYETAQTASLAFTITIKKALESMGLSLSMPADQLIKASRSIMGIGEGASGGDASESSS